jgi:hypothetical protein
MRNPEDKLLTIDTHHHMLPDFFWEETENANAPVGGLAPLRWSREASVSFMDDAGIDVAVVSLSTPGVHTGNNAKARALARRCNEFSAELISRCRPDALHQQIRTHAKREVHLLSRWRLDSLPGRAFRDH